MKIVLFTSIVLLPILSSCDSLLPQAPDAEEVLAEPIPDLTDAQLASHIAGDEEFGRVFSPEEGLGPLFVSASCESCHIGDGKGHPVTNLTRFGRMHDGTYSALEDLGGPQLQHRSIPGYPAEEIPAEATGITRLMPPAVTGLGYLEAIEDASILTLADPDDSDGDGISGVPSWIENPDFLPAPVDRVQNDGKVIGRFGKKAGAINLLHQTVVAYLQDMGVTTEFLPQDTYNVQAGIQTGDTASDPEISTEIVNNVVFYLRTLKVPPRRNAEDENVQAGERIFSDIGCAGCHVTALMTGPSDVEALSNKTIFPYSDLLLHDMGPELDDGYTEGSATSSEWRTAPLWGIGLAADSQGGRAFYLHDGRATTLDEAIQYHGGEAALSRDRYANMSSDEQAQLIAFLMSL